MDRFYVFIIRNDVWILILCALGLFWYTTEFIRAQRMLGRAVFNLERENGTRMRNNALMFMAIFSAVILLIYFVNARIAPTLSTEQLQIQPTPTPDIFLTPLSSPTPLGGPIEQLPTATPPLAPTVTLPGEQPNADGDEDGITLADTPTPAVIPTPFIACNQDLNISVPTDGSAIAGDMTFFGTAETDNFASYVMEINGPETQGQWANLLGRVIEQPVREGFLGENNLQSWENGPYLIRLTAMDGGGNPIGQCVISVTLINQ